MINVITVHWKTAKWIPAQLSYLERNLNAPFRVFASLNEIEDPALHERFYYSADIEGEHPDKLNALTEVVMDQSNADDILLFLDGDAFPIQPLHPWLEGAIDRHRLVAIQRGELFQDVRPHPSFCAARVGFWKELGCDWTPEDFLTASGYVMRDAGGRLARLLESNQVDWLPLVRTNTFNPHSLWFGVYGHRVYHHGAGFRSRVTQPERLRLQKLYTYVPGDVPLGVLVMRAVKTPSVLLRARPRHARMVVRGARRTMRRLYASRFVEQADSESDEVFERLQSDEHFYREFDSSIS